MNYKLYNLWAFALSMTHLNNLCVQVLYQNFWFFVPMPLFVAMSVNSKEDEYQLSLKLNHNFIS